MLDITRISHTVVYKEEWMKQRLGKITASLVSELISTDSAKGKFDPGGNTYIQGLAGEILTGISARKEFFNSYTDYGNSMEPEAIKYFCEITGRGVVRNKEYDGMGKEIEGDTHRLIILDEYTGCTPDALTHNAASEDKLFDSTGTKLLIKPLECKCPPVHHRFIKLFKCNTPQELEKIEKKYYWQTLMQMYACNSMEAYFLAYNPSFPIKGKLITFKKTELVDDLAKLSNTIHHAKNEIIKTIKTLNNQL